MSDAPPSRRSRSSDHASLSLLREQIRADVEADMAEDEEERRGMRQRFFFHMAGKGPDGEGLGWRD